VRNGYRIDTGGSDHSKSLLHRLPITSMGHLKSKRLRGSVFSCNAMASTSSRLCTDRSVPFGRYWRIRPLIFVAATLRRPMRVAEDGSHASSLGDLGVRHLPPLVVGHAVTHRQRHADERYTEAPIADGCRRITSS